MKECGACANFNYKANSCKRGKRKFPVYSTTPACDDTDGFVERVYF
jgi:hypothetical protein